MPGLEFVTHILDADPGTLGVAQEFTLAGYRQRSALATTLPLAATSLLRDPLGDSLRDSLGDSLGDSVGDHLGDSSLAFAAAIAPLESGALTPHSAAVQVTLP